MSPKWYEAVAEEIKNSYYQEQLRWKKAPESILLGEASSLINIAGYKSYPDRTSAVMFAMRNFGSDPDMFYIPKDEEYVSRSAGIGRMLAERVRGQSNQDVVAAGHLKAWLSSDRESFSSFYLSRILTFNARSNNRTLVPLPQLINLLTNWDSYKQYSITDITSDYFNTVRKTEKQGA